jgi:hypothetical protein
MVHHSSDSKPPAVMAQVDRKALLGCVEGDLSLLCELIRISERNAGDLLEKLRSAVLTGDCRQIEHTAHTMKSMLAQLAAGPTAEAAGHLEHMGKTGNLKEAADAFDLLEQELRRVHQVLSEICAEAAH